MVNSIVNSRTVLLYRDEDGYFIAEVPSLPGCISQGENRTDALNNIKEAIDLHIEVLRDRGEPIPPDTIEVVRV
ncbi:MAG: type II toxin-antitoxin system HicB family antitoxin [Limnoraphis robusta]|uniref:type II toxin-antitoxin system HicB family antitoxin n=1 Tax=Limnoraphis robusta TaxID=1118279 RepID=UPI00061AFD00|nr:type II toxin-antitoxin system HicB family antitoxin [Limnoraphis robusta]MEA5500861.1 type II toxin-antitoxin system HicB family antitoxin [Limnoraphis robusta BA-68 BA1]